MILIIMGVSGSGKTTVGKLLAERIDYRFLDADDYHPASNIAKMKAGQALTDADRLPWLERIRDVVTGKDRIVLACSALKQSYRSILTVNVEVKFIYLKSGRETARKRVEEREGHFMSSALIDSQFEALEEPDDALSVDASGSPEEIVESVMTRLKEIL